MNCILQFNLKEAKECVSQLYTPHLECLGTLVDRAVL